MVRRRLFDKVGYFNEDRFWRIGEDSEFFFRVTKNHPVGFIDEVLARYRKSDAGITNNNWTYTPKVFPIHAWLLEHPEYWSSRVPRREIVDVIVEDCKENAMYWRYSGQKHHARYFAAKWILYRPMDWRGWMELIKSCITR